MLSYNSLTYVQDMKIGHYSRFTWSPDAETHIPLLRATVIEAENWPWRELPHSTLSQRRVNSFGIQ